MMPKVLLPEFHRAVRNELGPGAAVLNNFDLAGEGRVRFVAFSNGDFSICLREILFGEVPNGAPARTPLRGGSTSSGSRPIRYLRPFTVAPILMRRPERRMKPVASRWS